jgi:hypothetical protein
MKASEQVRVAVALFDRRELDIVAVCWCSLVLFLRNCRKRDFHIAHVAWRLCDCVMNGQKSYGLDKSVPIELDETDS